MLSMAFLRSSMAESELLDVHLKRSVQDEGSQRGQDKVAVFVTVFGGGVAG